MTQIITKFKSGDHSFYIRLALPADYIKVKNLMYDVANWLHENGSVQWNDILNGIDVHQTDKCIDRKEVFLFENKNEIAALMIIRNKPSEWDQTLWSQKSSDNAFYLHRLMVNRAYKGLQLSEKMITFAIQKALAEKVPFVRLDCIETNEYLNQLYQRLGFKRSGSKNGFSLYEQFISLKYGY